MLKQRIIDDIEARTSQKYSSWRIGLANKPDDCRKECERDGERTDFWLDWETDSPADAREILTRFKNRGMKEMPGGDLSPGKYVFVFVF